MPDVISEIPTLVTKPESGSYANVTLYVFPDKIPALNWLISAVVVPSASSAVGAGKSVFSDKSSLVIAINSDASSAFLLWLLTLSHNCFTCVPLCLPL